MNMRERAALYGANKAESLSREYLGAGDMGTALARGAGACLGLHDGCPAGDWPRPPMRDWTKHEGTEGLCEIARHMTDLVAEVRRLTAALDAARREGAEGMREAAVAMIGRRITAWDDDADECGDEDAATRWEEATAIRDAIRALPLDAPGGGS